MVAIFTGTGFGFERGSGSTLGGVGLLGGAAQGRGGEGVYVNAATGNLLLQKQDEYLVGRGPDASVTRTYNSLTTLADDNNDKWRHSNDRRVYGLTGTLNTAGSTVKRVSGDGTEIVYTWDAARSAYLARDGGGAYDTIVSGSSEWVWTDGDSLTVERYVNDTVGRIKSVADHLGTVMTFTYDASGRMTLATTNDGSWIRYDWNGTTQNLAQIVTGYTDLATSTAKTQTTTRYGYDASNRLQTVTVDLSPGDNSITDGKTFVTTYGYDASNRVNSISQSDGSSMTMSFDASGRVQTLSQSVDGTVYRSTTINYYAGYTIVVDPAGLTTRFDYSAAGNLTKITAPPAFTGAAAQVTQFAYNANGDLTSTTDPRGEVTTYSNFTANGLAQTIVDRAGATTTRTYSTQNRLLSETRSGVDSTGASVAQTWRYVYDAVGALTFTISPEGRVTQFVRNSAGMTTSENEYTEAAYTTAGTPTYAAMLSWVSGLADKSWIKTTTYQYDARLQMTLSRQHGIANAAGVGQTTNGVTETLYVRDQAGRLLSTNALGQTPTTYVYDGMGRIIASTDGGGNITTIVYNDVGTTTTSTTTITTTSGGARYETYNKAGDLINLYNHGTNVTGTITQFNTFDKLGRLRTTTPLLNAKLFYHYDSAGRQVGLVTSEGFLTEYRYDANNRLIATIDYRNVVTAANLATLADPDNTLTIAALRPAPHAQDTSNWTIYDDEGRVLQTIAGDGSTRISSYDASGRLQKTTSHVTKIAAATVAGFFTTPPTAVITPAAHANDTVLRNFYDKDGLLIGAIDSQKFVTRNTYDSSGQLTATTRFANATTAASPATASFAAILAGVTASADDRTTRNVYDGRGLLRYAIDPLLQVTLYDYDAAGNITRECRYPNALAAATTDFTYDAVTTAVAAQNSYSNRVLTFNVYDSAGRLAYGVQQSSSATSHDATVTAYFYDVGGNLIRTVEYAQRRLGTYTLPTKADMDTWAAGQASNADNRVTRMWYNGRGMMTYVVNAEGYVTFTAYNAMGLRYAEQAYLNKVTVTDATTYAEIKAAATGANYSRTRIYDSLGRLTREQDYTGTSTTFSYHGATDLVVSQVRASNGTAQEQSTTTNTYDAAGRVITTTAGAGQPETATTTYAYDGRGTLTSTTDPRAKITSYTYDANGRVLTETNALSGVTRYEYNAFGEVWKLTDPQSVVTYSWHDKLGRVTHQRDGENYLTTSTYTAFGDLASVTRWKTKLTGTAAMATPPTGTPATLDATTTFTYGKHGQAMTSTDALGKIEYYAYNAFGDRTSVTNRLSLITYYTYDRLGQVTREYYDAYTLNTVGGSTVQGNFTQKTYEYDARGNRAKLIEGFSTTAAGAVTALRTTLYAYNGNGQVTTVTRDAVTTIADDMVTLTTGVLPTETYEYDKRGNVIKSVDAGGAATFFYYDDLDRKIGEVRQLSATHGVLTLTEYDKNGNATAVKVYETLVTLPATAGATAPATPAGLFRQTNFAYDNLNRMTSSTVVGNTGNLITTTSSGATYMRQTFTATAVDQIVSLATDEAHWQPVTSGGQLAVQIGVEATGAIGTLYLKAHFRDASGVYISGIDVGSLTGVQAFNTRMAGAITAPTGAATMRLEVYVYTSGAGAGALSLTQPMVSAGSTIPAYTAGPPNIIFNSAFSSADGWLVGYNPHGIATGAITVGVGGQTTTTANPITTYQYDQNGNVVKLIDANGAATWSWYDKLNLKIAEVDAEGYLTTWFYDAEGAVTSETRFARRYTGTLTTATPPSGTSDAGDRTTNYVYDKNGNRTLETRLNVQAWTINPTSGAMTAAGTNATIAYTYNALNQVTTKTVAGESVATYVYHASGRLDIEERAQFTDANGASVTPKTVYHNDALGNLTRLAQEGNAGTYAVANRETNYVYGEGGRLLSMTDAEGKTHAYYYDAAGRLKKDAYARVINTTTASNSAALSTINEAQTTTYDIAGRAIRKGVYSTVGGVFKLVDYASFDYNVFGQVTRQGSGSNHVSDVTLGSALYQTTNTYDAAGNLVASNAGDGVWKFFRYDKVGNQTGMITSAGYATTASGTFASMLAQIGLNTVNGTWTFYDKRGQATQVVEEGRDGGSFTNTMLVSSRSYNAFGEVVNEVDARGGAMAYTYNTMGRKLRAESPGVRIKAENGRENWIKPSEDFYYDLGGRLIATRDAKGAYAQSTAGKYVSKTANTGILTRYALLAGTGYDGEQAQISTAFHQDGSKQQTLYDKMGDARVVRSQLFNYGNPTAETKYFTEQNFNRLGQLTQVKHERESVGSTDANRLVDNFVYDQFGQRIQHANNQYGAAVLDKTAYDALGRIVSQTDMENHVVNTSYLWSGTLATKINGLSVTFGGWQATTSYSDNTMTSAEQTDVFGREVWKRDLGGHEFTSGYDLAGRMVSRTTGSTVQSWQWFNSGLLKQSSGLNGVEAYTYDTGGNRLTEVLTLGGATIKNAAATYDALGRLSTYTQASATYTNGSSYVTPEVTSAYVYDEAGNIRQTTSTRKTLNTQGAPSAAVTTDDFWYKYDAFDRLIVDKGMLTGAAGAAGTQIVRGIKAGAPSHGETIEYNQAGQRINVTRTEFMPAYFDGTTYQPDLYNEVRDIYGYKGDGNLERISISRGIALSGIYNPGTGQYELPSSLPSAPATGTLSSSFSHDLMGRQTAQSDHNSLAITIYSRTTTFNKIGQKTKDDSWVKNASGNFIYTVDNYSYANSGQYYLGSVYRVDGTSRVNSGSTDTTSTVNTYQWFDSAVQSSITHKPKASTTYTTTFYNDAFGQINSVYIADGRPRWVYYKLDGSGQIIRRDEQDGNAATGDPHEVWYRFNGRELAYVGNDGTENVDASAAIAGRMTTSANGPFRYGLTTSVSYGDTSGGSYQAINAFNQGSSAGGYEVQTTGESLRSVALQLWGDASLWYKLAEANGLQADAALIQGQRLSVPAGVVRTSFNADTLKPYDANEAIGNVSPTTPKPKKKNNCGVFGQILLAAVAIAVTAIALPAGGMASASLMQGALAGTAGAAASQTVGVATGIQSNFDFKGIALAAIGGAVGAGVNLGNVTGSPFLSDVANGAVRNAVTQGIGVATGLQSKFSWAGVAAAGIGAGVGQGVTRELGTAKGLFGMRADAGSFASDMASTSASLMANAATRSALSGTSFGDNVMRGLPDALGGLAGRALGRAANTAIATARAKAEQAAGDPTNQGNATVGSQVEGLVAYQSLGGRPADRLASQTNGYLDPSGTAYEIVVVASQQGKIDHRNISDAQFEAIDFIAKAAGWSDAQQNARVHQVAANNIQRAFLGHFAQPPSLSAITNGALRIGGAMFEGAYGAASGLADLHGDIISPARFGALERWTARRASIANGQFIRGPVNEYVNALDMFFDGDDLSGLARIAGGSLLSAGVAGAVGKAGRVGGVAAERTAPEFITVFRGDRAGTTVIKSAAAREGGYASSQRIIDSNDFEDLFRSHAISSSSPPSPFISVTTDPAVARYFSGPTGVVNEFRIPLSRATNNPFNNYVVPAGPGGQLIPEAEFLVPNYIRPSEFVRKR